MNPGLYLSLIAGCSAALIAYSAFFVRGDLGGVFAYLRARGALRRLRESGADAGAVTAATDQLHALGRTVADPDFALRMLPVAALIGLAVAVLIWRLFQRQGAARAAGTRPDIEERMVYRLAHRWGRPFTLADLSAHSPLTGDQARTVTQRMVEAGRLRRDGDGYRLP